MARYTNIDTGRHSGLANVVDPVVVKPLTDSNTASVNDVETPVNKYGNAPATGSTVHTHTVSQ